MPTVSAATPASSLSTAPPDRMRHRVVAAGLGLGAVVLAGLLVTTPWGERNAIGYDDIAPLRDPAWAGMFADSLAFAVVAITASLVVLAQVRTRGRVLGLVGAVAAFLGGVLFAMGSYAFAAFAWYATSNAVPPNSGRALMAYSADHPEHLRAPAMAGFLLYTIGSLLLSAALIRGRAVPVAGPVAFIVLTLAQFLPIPGRGPSPPSSCTPSRRGSVPDICRAGPGRGPCW